MCNFFYNSLWLCAWNWCSSIYSISFRNEDRDRFIFQRKHDYHFGCCICHFFFYSHKAFYYMRHFLFNAVISVAYRLYFILFFLSRISVNKSKRSSCFSFYIPEICYYRQKDVYMYTVQCNTFIWWAYTWKKLLLSEWRTITQGKRRATRRNEQQLQNGEKEKRDGKKSAYATWEIQLNLQNAGK